MSENVEINGLTLLPIKDAAKLVSYSRDYVARLAREKKIVASQIGRQWFVDIISLRSFAEASTLEQSIRQQQLSDERKREQALKEEMSEIKNTFKAKRHHVAFQAQLVSCLALVFGLLAGTTLFTVSSLSSENISPNFVAGLTLTSTSVITNSRESSLPQVVEEDTTLAQVEPQVITTLNTVSEKLIFLDETEVKELSGVDTKGIFLLPQNGQLQDIEQVKKMFSDDLDIKFVNESTGIIVYVRENGEQVEFPFVSVPLSDEAAVKSGNI